MNGYFDWLCALVSPPPGEQERTFLFLFRAMYRKTFYALVPYDDNRDMDGRALREEYAATTRRRTQDDGASSFLEVLIALSKRIGFNMSGIVEDSSTRRWFWEMLDNCGLSRYDDQTFMEKGADWIVDDILEMILSRTYSHTGKGGLFPLMRPRVDQRTVELWTQANEYLLDMYD